MITDCQPFFYLLYSNTLFFSDVVLYTMTFHTCKICNFAENSSLSNGKENDTNEKVSIIVGGAYFFNAVLQLIYVHTV